MTAFLVSGIAGTVPGVVGEPYRDASGNEYLPMFVQPVLVYEADGPALRRAYERALGRGVTPAIYTRELFDTNHDGHTRLVQRPLFREYHPYRQADHDQPRHHPRSWA